MNLPQSKATSGMAKTRQSNLRRLPGEAGIWGFAFADMLIFTLLFVVFLHYRQQEPALFASAHRALNVGLGTLNTLLLLTSSWCVAQAVRHASVGSIGRSRRLVQGAAACGGAFAGVKVWEYIAKATSGFPITDGYFFMFFYALTGIHLLHVILGLGVLMFLSGKLRTGEIGQSNLAPLESGATYWHLVDLLWLVLFPLLYLLG